MNDEALKNELMKLEAMLPGAHEREKNPPKTQKKKIKAKKRSGRTLAERSRHDRASHHVEDKRIETLLERLDRAKHD